MENGWRTTQARRVLLQQVAPAYHRASGSHRHQILEDFVTTTGYARTYVLWLLNHVEEVFAPPATVLRRRYRPEVEAVLVLAWQTLNRLCAKRLIPFLPDLLESLEEKGQVQLSQEQRSQLLSMSAATADRLLRDHRYTHPHGLSTTKAGPLLKQQIPIRTFAQWDDAQGLHLLGGKRGAGVAAADRARGVLAHPFPKSPKGRRAWVFCARYFESILEIWKVQKNCQ